MEVDLHYEIVNREENNYRFNVSEYNTDYLFIINTKLEYSTFLEGNGDEFCYDIAVDVEGNVYIAGRTGTSNFPTQYVALVDSLNVEYDIFVCKLNSQGNVLVYSTF